MMGRNFGHGPALDDRPALLLELLDGASTLGVALTQEQAAQMLSFLSLLLEWNGKVNLTAITEPMRLIDEHLVDSLSLVATLVGRNREKILDIGAGGGFPGVVLAIALPEKNFTLVDSIGKKIGFLKSAAAHLGLKNLRALQTRATGRASEEQLEGADCVVSRAFLAPTEWAHLAQHYLRSGGLAVAMLGAETMEPASLPSTLRRLDEQRYLLPRSRAARRILLWERLSGGSST